MIDIEKYDFSFIALSMQVNLMVKSARTLKDNKKIDVAEIGDGNSKTGKRKLVDIKKRIKNLTSNELSLLLNGDLITQRQIAFLSICKTHFFIRDFTVEILREKLLVYDYQLTEGDYIIFYRRKSEMHPEMDKLTEKTQNKIRQVTFKILEQAGIIDDVKSKTIQPQLLEHSVIRTIEEDDKEWLKIFLMSDLDIENLNK
ncbi:BrxA family protein [uncultured Draconibacterium sp.]|uniref:BrxA family protein n=1 Tax=uncultured Draconibacterium sp. TaxID=1573823 RepID=UPI0029C9ACB2|nr:BrxA family protein [uncultured Draconibacterium sp.]